MATIATHNGSSVSRGHNLRKEEIVSKEEHIDPDGIHETWHDEAPRQAYERLFGQAVREYNDKQTRDDRKIVNYYNDVRADQRRHVTYEMIIGIYPADGETIADGTGKDIMKEFVRTWPERNPNLQLVGAYYHADEQGKAPHVHIDYIPVAHGYTRGLAVQNGLVKAFGEMGFTGTAKVTAQIKWEKRENEVLETLCNGRGIAVEHPQEGKGVKHLHTQAYKAEQELQKTKDSLDFHKERAEIQRNRNKSLQERKSVLSADVERMQEKKQDLQNDIATLQQKQESARSSVEMLRKFADSKQEQIEQLEQLEEKYKVKEQELKDSIAALHQEEGRARSSFEMFRKMADSQKEQIERLKEKYRELESQPPIRKEVEVKIPKYIDTPVKRVIEVEKEVLVERVVETEKNYKTMAEKALNAFRMQSEWLERKGLSAESYNELCHDMDFLQTNKTVYPRNRARVEPLYPDGETSRSGSFHQNR